MKNTLKKITAAVMAIMALTSCSVVGKKPSDSAVSSDSLKAAHQGSDEHDKKDDIVLTLAMSGDSSGMDKTIEEFNAADNGYQVQIKRYSENIDENGVRVSLGVEEGRYEDLEILQDIMNTTDIDIICNMSFSNESYYQILQNKGAFADLYPFMENDAEVNKNTLNAHVLEVNEIDGKLYMLPDFYGINTLTGETKYVGTKENWTFDEFAEHWNAMPEGSTFCGAMQAETIYNIVLSHNLSSFIDYKNAEVHFDSPRFKEMLEFCNQFELITGEKATYDFDSPYFVGEGMLSGIMSARSCNPANGNTTHVGYPSEDGSGAYFLSQGYCYSINAKISPERQKAAWEFIRTFATEEWQLDNVIPFFEGTVNTPAYYSTEMGFCINENAFDKVADIILNDQIYSTTMVDKGVSYERTYPTAEDVEQLRRYINSVNRWETVLDSSLWIIINDEVMAYFAGEKTLDECVSLIQNRAAIWISEQS